MAKTAEKAAKPAKAQNERSLSHTLWADEPEEHDYPAAFDYLTLLFPEKTAHAIVAELRQGKIFHRKAKDLLRASGLTLLSSDNSHVNKDMKKVARGIKLSPVLLVRGDLACGRPLLVADGYHRVCASQHLDENTDIPCKIADVPEV